MSSVKSVLHFQGDKPRFVAVHPVRPWVAIVSKHNYDVTVYDYEECIDVTKFRIASIEEDRREDVELQRAMLGEGGTIDRSAPKLGGVMGVSFYDTNTIHWGVYPYRGKDIKDVFQMAVDSQCALHGVLGKYVIVVMEYRVALYNVLNPSQQSSEVNSTQIDGKTFLCAEPLLTAPFLALGCSDGCVRLWNYEQRAVLPMRVVGPHSKGINNLSVLHRSLESVLAGHVTLFCASMDGAVSSITLSKIPGNDKNAWKPTIDWQSPKAHGETVLSLSYCHALNQVLTLSVSGTVVLHDAKTGSEHRRIMPSKKITKPAQCLYLGTKRILLVCEHSHVYYASLEGSAQPLNDWCDLAVAARKKDVHVYGATAHPLNPQIVFFTSNNGLIQIQSDSVEASGKLARNGFGGIINGSQVVCALGGSVSVKEIGTTSAGVTVANVGDPNTSVFPSLNQKYYACLRRGTKQLQIFDGYSHREIPFPGGSPVSAESIEWHLYDDLFSVLTDKKRVQIFKLVDSVMTVVAADVVTVSPPAGICGGRWLCVMYNLGGSGEDMMQFYRWSGAGSVGGFIPKANRIVWDSRGAMCAMVYDERIVFMSAVNRNFKFLGAVAVARVSNAVFHGGTLFAVTPTSVVALFPASASGRVSIEEIATIDVTTHYGSIAAKCEEEWLVGATYVHVRPPGELEILGVVEGSKLVVMDSNRMGHILHISNPAVQCKALIQSGNLKQALAAIERYHLSPEGFAAFLLERGEFSTIGCIPGLNWETKVQVAQSKHDELALVALLKDAAKLDIDLEKKKSVAESLILQAPQQPLPEVISLLRSYEVGKQK